MNSRKHENAMYLHQEEGRALSPRDTNLARIETALLDALWCSEAPLSKGALRRAVNAHLAQPASPHQITARLLRLQDLGYIALTRHGTGWLCVYVR